MEKEFSRGWAELEVKKDKLWAGGYNMYWKIDFKGLGIQRNDVIKNKPLSKSLMLPDVSFT